MKLILTTIAACALLPLGALAQNSFPAPPPDLSVSTEGPDFFIGTGLCNTQLLQKIFCIFFGSKRKKRKTNK